jgi:hypothetical protein
MLLITGGGGLLTAMVNGAEFDCGGDALSATVTVKGDETRLVGVPVTIPVAARRRPVGSEPDVTAHVSGSNPPEAVNWKEYDDPMVAVAGTKFAGITGGSGLLTLTVTGMDPVPAGEALSVAVTVKVYAPALVGVPDSEPSVARVSPGGGGAPLVTDQVNGGEPPLATLN